MKKAIKVLSSAAIAATLVAPTVAVQPAFAASTYTVSGVKNASAGQTIDGITRIGVSLPSATLTGPKTFQLRLPADATAKINNMTSDTPVTFSQSGVATGVKQEVETAVTNGATATPTADVVFKVKDKEIKVNGITATDTAASVATKIATAINTEGTYTAAAGTGANANKITITAPTEAVNDPDLTLRLIDAKGSGITLGDSVTTKYGVAPATSSDSYVPNVVENQAGNQVGSVTIAPRNGDGSGNAQVFDITVVPSATTAVKGLFYLDLTNIKVPSGISGALNATIDSADDTFSNADIKIAQVGNGSVTTSIDGTIALTPGNKNDAVKTIRVKEDSAGAFAKGQKYKLELPDGFEWSDAPSYGTVVWGDTNARLKFITGLNDDTVEFKVVDRDGNDYATKTATQFAIDGLKVRVDDNDATKGEVKVTVKGDVSRTNDSIVIGTYGTTKVKYLVLKQKQFMLAKQVKRLRM